MGKDIGTVLGGIGTAACAVGSVVTFGQVDAINEATENCAKYTEDNWNESNAKHTGAMIGTSVAVVATVGQIDSLNELNERNAKRAGNTFVTSADEMADSIPVVGHVKGGIHYAVGDSEGGDRAMKNASRTTGVIAAGAGGFLVGGPAGAVASGIAGGAAMDGATTGIESAVHGKYMPNGTLASLDTAIYAEGSERAGGILGVISAPVMDGFAGRAAGNVVKGRIGPKVGKSSAALAEEAGALRRVGRGLKNVGKAGAHISMQQFRQQLELILAEQCIAMGAVVFGDSKVFTYAVYTVQAVKILRDFKRGKKMEDRISKTNLINTALKLKATYGKVENYQQSLKDAEDEVKKQKAEDEKAVRLAQNTNANQQTVRNLQEKAARSKNLLNEIQEAQATVRTQEFSEAVNDENYGGF